MYLYSNGVPTKEFLNITMDKYGYMNEFGGFYTDGDGTVSLKSLKSFCAENKDFVSEKMVQNVDHHNILFSRETIKTLASFLKRLRP